jgi:hypothetical protein
MTAVKPGCCLLGRTPVALHLISEIIVHGNFKQCRAKREVTDGCPENSPMKIFPRKLQAYEALYLFNRLIEATLESLDGLERLGLLRGEDLSEYKIRIEHTSAEANQDLTDRLQEHETEECVRFDRVQLDLENRRQDPNDVFFAAQDRKREIKQQITELQQALERQSQRPKRQKKKAQK